MTNFLDLEVRSRIGELAATQKSVESFIDWFAANTVDDRTPLIEAVESLLGEASEFTVEEFVAALREAAKPVESPGFWTAMPQGAGSLRVAMAGAMQDVVLSVTSSSSRSHLIATPGISAQRDRATADT